MCTAFSGRRSRGITSLTIDARAAHKGEEVTSIHPSPKVHFYLCFCCRSIVICCQVASRGSVEHYKKRGIVAPLVGKQAHKSQTPRAKVTHPYTVPQITCTGFFSSKLSLLPHLSLLHQHIPDSKSSFSRPSAAFPSSTQIPRKTRAAVKSIWRCSDTPLSRRLCPAMIHGLSSHCFCSLQLSTAFRAKNFHCNTHSTEWATGDISSQTWVFVTLRVPCCWAWVVLQPAWRNISRFKNWSWRLSLNFGIIFSISHRWQRTRPLGTAAGQWWQTTCATTVLCHVPGTEHPCRTQPSALPSSKKPQWWSRTGLAALSS